MRLARKFSETEADIRCMVVGGGYPSLSERLQECPCLTRCQDVAQVLPEKLVPGERLAGRRWQLREIGIAPIESDHVASRYERPDLPVCPHTRRKRSARIGDECSDRCERACLGWRCLREVLFPRWVG